jgi:hypothetical protein
VIPTIGYTFDGRGGRMEVMTVAKTGVLECGSGELATDGTRIEHRWEETGVLEWWETERSNGVVEYWSDGWTPDRAWRRIPAYRINCVAAAGLRHSRAPGKRRVENRVGTGKWWNFSHLVIGFYRLETVLTRLFPCFSTQVVDFPRMAMARLFSERARIGFSASKREVAI